MLFKKPAPPAPKKSLTSILDFHLNRYARAYTINRHMMTVLLGCLSLRTITSSKTRKVRPETTILLSLN